MITERGTIKTSTPITEQVNKELNKRVFALSIVYIILSAIFLALGFVIYLLTDDSYGLVLLVCGAILCACGIIMIGAVRAAKNLNLKRQKVDEAEFFRDHFMAYEYTNGELTTTSKIYYSWLIKIKETPNYLFLYNTRATAFAVDKNALPLSELNTVRMLLGRPVAGGEQATVQPPVQTSELAATDSVEPAEPFMDITDNKEE